MISKELEMEVEHSVLLGKGKCFANQPADALPQGVIQPLNVIGLPLRFADHGMGSPWQPVVGAPQVAEAAATPIRVGQLTPKAQTTRHRPITDEER